MKKNIFTLVSIVTLLSLTQCNKEKACTYDFRLITISLTYDDGQPVFLDSCTVFWKNENRYLRTASFSRDELINSKGYYSIVDDNMQEELEGREEIMHFTGFLNNEIICEKDVLVGADHCHIKYLGTEPLTQTIYR